MKPHLGPALLLLALGCHTDGVGATSEFPEVLASRVEANPDNVLSALVSTQVRFADSVAVRFRRAGESQDSTTPAVKAGGDSTVVPVLGLIADAQYVFRIVAYHAHQTAVGDSLALTTGALPDDLPEYVASGPDPSPGYVVFAAGMYGLAIDNSGRVVWYHRFPDGPGLNFMPQPTGRYAARPTTPNPNDADPWVDIDVLGAVARTFGCAGGLIPRFHDLIEASDQSYWVLCDETRTMDLSSLGGNAEAKVTGTVVQHVDGAGGLLFQWSSFDHFAITDIDSASRSGSTVNWTHGNALALDGDGNLLVSFRSLGEITKINTVSGDVMWRLGGPRNQFAFVDGPTPGFSRQHGLRLTAPGQLVLLDNLGDPSTSRAERYTVDAEHRTARLVAAYAPEHPVIALLGGSTQDLAGHHTLVSYGTAGRVEEYDASGRMVWQIEGNPGYVFRAQRIRSLYYPGVN